MANHPRCGTCTWSEPVAQDMNYVVCYGAPPVPVLMPTQAPDGSQAIGIQLLRPNLPRTERGCSRHMPKPLEAVATEPGKVV